MNRNSASALLLLAALANGASANSYAGQNAKPAKPPVSSQKKDPVKRVQPSDVPGLPPEFLEKLNTRGCTIPQFDSGSAAPRAATNGTAANAAGNATADGSTGSAAADGSTQPSNAIHGEFARRGQQDWAVLCSKGASSTIVIHWGKPTACPSQLARLDDEHFMQKGADRKVHYSRALYASDPARDASLHRGPKDMSHQGIHDAFVGKSSSLFYCNEGKWRIYPGAD